MNLIPSRAMRSRFGVSSAGCPYTPKSPQPICKIPPSAAGSSGKQINKSFGPFCSRAEVHVVEQVRTDANFVCTLLCVLTDRQTDLSVCVCLSACVRACVRVCEYICPVSSKWKKSERTSSMNMTTKFGFVAPATAPVVTVNSSNARVTRVDTVIFSRRGRHIVFRW